MNAMLLVMSVAASGLASANPPAALERKDIPLVLELRQSPLTVQFLNTGKVPLHILKPLDGSEWCWLMPHYKLTVTDDQGCEIKLATRCKLHGFPYSGTKWPDDYQVTIAPGHSYKHALYLTHELPAAGAYTLRFQYVFTPKVKQTPGNNRYPPDLWRGQATSNTIQLKLAPP